MIKRIFFLLAASFFFIAATAPLFAQEEKTPILLTGPEDWIFERMELPLGFAPQVKYEGFEELRFAKGWSDRESENYFNYLFVLSLDEQPKIKAKQLTKTLEAYYRGLATAVAGGKDFTVEPERITVNLYKTKGRLGKRKTYQAHVLFQDAFNGGEEIQLNMEIEVSRDQANGKTLVFALVCVEPFNAPRWNDLRQIREDLGL